ncbi:MAG TPA: MFS transporter [Bryobacteraceae bacterium]|jgi:MFS family permease
MGWRSGFFYGWVVVATAAFGLLLGAFPIVVFSFGVFAVSYAREFHTGRGVVSLAFTLHNLFAGFFAVFIGRLCDRFGARRVILPGLAMLSLIMISAEAIGSKIWQLYVFYAALGAVDDATTSVPYALVISRWFNRRRGLALGFMMLGLGAGSVVVPPLAQQCMVGYGWRVAFVMAGGAVLLIAIPVVGVFLKESPQQMGLLPDGAARIPEAKSEREGLAWREIRNSGTFWLVIGMFALLTVSVQACIIHMPQLLMDRGASAGEAAAAASVIGFAVMAGRFITGYLLDHLFGPYLASFMCAIAAFAIAALWSGAEGVPALVCGFLIGFVFGAEMDIVPYLMSRYFGLRSLGTAFGFGFGVLVVTAGLGPLMMGFGFDRTGSYRAPLAGFFIATLVASALLSRLGPYRFDAAETPRAPATVRSTVGC